MTRINTDLGKNGFTVTVTDGVRISDAYVAAN